MKSIRKTSNTTIIKFKDYDSFKQRCKEIGCYHLASLTGNYNMPACSYIYHATNVKKENNDLYIYDLACYSLLSNTFVLHRKLKVYYTKNGGFYSNVRFGKAWLNSFFDLPRNGIETAIIIPTEQVIKNEYLDV